jgi:hypothetical protein
MLCVHFLTCSSALKLSLSLTVVCIHNMDLNLKPSDCFLSWLLTIFIHQFYSNSSRRNSIIYGITKWTIQNRVLGKLQVAQLANTFSVSCGLFRCIIAFTKTYRIAQTLQRLEYGMGNRGIVAQFSAWVRDLSVYSSGSQQAAYPIGICDSLQRGKWTGARS